jgi:hypothetical protein
MEKIFTKYKSTVRGHKSQGQVYWVSSLVGHVPTFACGHVEEKEL